MVLYIHRRIQNLKYILLVRVSAYKRTASSSAVISDTVPVVYYVAEFG